VSSRTFAVKIRIVVFFPFDLEIFSRMCYSFQRKMSSSTSSLPSLPGKAKPYVIAHRGNLVACPENTIAAFNKAIADGADILETDLHLTSDNEFVCIHDAAVDRTTNGSGEVAQLTLAQLKKLSASCGRAEFKDERIPRLQEVIELLPSDTALLLELKSDRFLEEQVGRRLVKILDNTGIRHRTIVGSFSFARIQMMQAVASDLLTGWLSMSNPFPKPGAQVLGPFWPLLLLNPFYVRQAHARGQAVCPLDPKPDSRLWFYKCLNCDAVLTNNPEKTRRVLEKLSRQ
jgi:glycerophosphoryl diester phosphodiesterase